jgi:uncharacterized protein YneF (UPF0154 family)
MGVFMNWLKFFFVILSLLVGIAVGSYINKHIVILQKDELKKIEEIEEKVTGKPLQLNSLNSTTH